MTEPSKPPSDLPPLADRDQLVAALGERYVDVQYVFVQFMSEHLVDCARAFDGDLAQMLVLAIIGQSHLHAVRAQLGAPVAYGISALRIADVTGLPRETTRRKLAKLEQRGWIVHGNDGWRLAGASPTNTQARGDLADVDRRGLERLARLHGEIARLLSRPPRLKPTQNG